jgi:D-glycero-alpha-D-manno-heptose 1-phosphate guanylyltransferase
VEAIILAGGFGTRLQPVVSDIPKSMAVINGRPFLEYLLDYLILQGINKVVLSVGYKSEIIHDHFKDNYKSVEISYAVEQEPLGTGGGIRLAFWKVEGQRAIILNGDSLFRLDYNSMIAHHLKRKADATLALRKMDNTGRYGRVDLNRNKRIILFTEKNEKAGPGFINGGVYIIDKSFLMEPWFRGKFSIEKDCFERYYSESKMYGFPADGYFLDIGIPEDYLKAQHDFVQFED